ncbi:TolB-like 6-blade propeller-like protein [anaerobic digester metagenome]
MRIIIAFLFCLFLLGCRLNKSDLQYTVIETFPREMLLKGEPTGPINFFLRTQKVMLVDSFLVVVDVKKSPYSVFLLNPYAGDTLYSIAHNGLGPSEFISAWDIFLDSYLTKTFWVIDPNSRRFSMYEIDSILRGTLKPSKRVSVKAALVRPEDFVIQGDRIISNGAISGAQFAFFSKESGAFLGESDKIPTAVDLSKFAEDDIALAYKGEIGLRPNCRNIVAGTSSGDYLSIYDSCGVSQKVIRTKELLEPLFTVSEDGQFGFTQDNKYGFLDIACTNQYIYGLYSGREHDGDVEYTGKTLFVFTWEGEPVAKLNLDRYCIGICVDSDDKTLFALEVFAKQPIIRYELPDFESVLNTDN